jgi:Plasmid pRiA4b ORF-3-like protein
MSDPTLYSIYRLRVVLNGVSPLVWRRFLVSSKTQLADLHQILQLESTVNQVVSKRFAKKQQMQWTPRGAHLLLQTRTKVLNEDLEETFRGWYPAFRHDAEGLAA